MRTLVLPFDQASIEQASTLIRAGELVAFPTETVYGLGARADQASAVRKIFEAKGRPSTNPLIVHVADVEAAAALAAEFPPEAERLAEAFWPGPLTLVLKCRAGAVAGEVTAFGPTIALRVPAAPVARVLLSVCRVPIAAPSANRSTSISPTTAAHVVKSLGGRIALVLDGGPCEHGIESTIVDLSGLPAKGATLLRPGAVPIASLRRVVAVDDPGALLVSTRERAPAPGMSERHYAPRASLVVVPEDEAAPLLAAKRGLGLLVGAIVRPRQASFAPPVEILPEGPEGYAARLYAALHRLDDAGCSQIVVAAPPSEPGWEAVHDRLRRAAASPQETGIAEASSVVVAE